MTSQGTPIRDSISVREDSKTRRVTFPILVSVLFGLVLSPIGAFSQEMLNPILGQTLEVRPQEGRPDRLGVSVAIDGSNVLLGATMDKNWEGRSFGSAYLFDPFRGDFKDRYLLVPSADQNACLGCLQVAIEGNKVLFGVPFHDNNVGVAYLYDVSQQPNPLNPEEREKTILENPSPDSNDWFGISVAIDDNYAVIGAYFEHTGEEGGRIGAAYLFDSESGRFLRTSEVYRT